MPAPETTGATWTPLLVLHQVYADEPGVEVPSEAPSFIFLGPEDNELAVDVSAIPVAVATPRAGFHAQVTDALERNTRYAVWAVYGTTCDPADRDAPCHDALPPPSPDFREIGWFRTVEDGNGPPTQVDVAIDEQRLSRCDRSTNSCCLAAASVETTLTFTVDEAASPPPFYGFALISSDDSVETIMPLPQTVTLTVLCDGEGSAAPGRIAVPAGEYLVGYVRDDPLQAWDFTEFITLGSACPSEPADAGPDTTAHGDAGPDTRAMGGGGCAAAPVSPVRGGASFLVLAIVVLALRRPSWRRAPKAL